MTRRRRRADPTRYEARQALTKVTDRAARARLVLPSRSRTIWHKTMFDRRVPDGPRLAVTVYDMIHERYPEQFGPRDVIPASKRPWCEAADIVFAISSTTRDDLLERFKLPPDKVVVTPLGVTTVEPAPGPLPFRGAAVAPLRRRARQAVQELACARRCRRQRWVPRSGWRASDRRRHPTSSACSRHEDFVTGCLHRGRRSRPRPRVPCRLGPRVPVALRGIRAPTARGNGPGMSRGRRPHRRDARGARRRGDLLRPDRRRRPRRTRSTAAHRRATRRSSCAAAGRDRAADVHLAAHGRRRHSTGTEPSSADRHSVERRRPRSAATGRLLAEHPLTERAGEAQRVRGVALRPSQAIRWPPCRNQLARRRPA